MYVFIEVLQKKKKPDKKDAQHFNLLYDIVLFW